MRKFRRDVFSPTAGTGCLEEGWKNLAVQGGLSLSGRLKYLEGAAEIPLETAHTMPRNILVRFFPKLLDCGKIFS